MKAINPYLNFTGNAEEVFNFYRSVFGGEFTTIVRYRDTPAAEKVNGAEADKLMHIALPVGKDNVLMGTDILESLGGNVTQGNNFNISIFAESREETERLFNGLSAGGKILTPLADAFWGDYFGWCRDRYGVSWMVNFPSKSNQR